MIIYLNYTFSVLDKRLYTLYKGITLTPRVVQASSVSSHGQATFTRGASCLCFVRCPFTRLLWPRVMAPSRRSQSHRSRRAFGTKPALDSALVATGFRDVPPGLPSTMSLSAPDAWCLRPLHTFGAEGHQSTPSAPKVSAIRDRQGGGGLFLRNNTHTTRVASALSLNHHCTLHQTNRSHTRT
jgi:hypothetical protein